MTIINDEPYRDIVKLSKGHDRSAFSCGAPELDDYLKKLALQDARRYLAVSYVLCGSDSLRVLGYYTLSASTVRLGDLPDEMARKLPRYPDIPVTLIGRLAVDTSRHGCGVGEFLLMDALHRSYSQAGVIGAMAVVVDAKNDAAHDFCQKYGFQPFQDYPDRLFMPMSVIGKLFAS